MMCICPLFLFHMYVCYVCVFVCMYMAMRQIGYLPVCLLTSLWYWALNIKSPALCPWVIVRHVRQMPEVPR